MIGGRQAAGLLRRASRRISTRPDLSVVVVAHDMARELPRTLWSLSRRYQVGAEHLRYEVVVVDNGSAVPVDAEVFAGLAGTFRLHRVPDAPPSPAHAANVGLRLARGRQVALVLDGARMVSPGAVAAAVDAVDARPRAVATPIAFHLGPEHQSISVAKGYGPAQEDADLARIGWPEDGYRLFEISALAGANPQGFYGPVNESCFLVAPRRLWREVGGLDERFDLPGGGLVSLDLFSRMVSLRDVVVAVLVGEGSFHQVHGGVSTTPGAKHELWHRQFADLRGEGYQPPRFETVHRGEARGPAARFV